MLIDQFKAILPNVPANERPFLEQIIEGNQLIIEQAEALIEVFKAKHEGSGLAEAEAAYKAKRAEAKTVIAALLGLDESLVE